MTTTPQPIQQQAFSFTPPGTFSQGFGFVPTWLQISNPSSYYLTFPDYPEMGSIPPYTFGVVVAWNHGTGGSSNVTITTQNPPSYAPPVPSSTAQVQILATTNPDLGISPGLSTVSNGLHSTLLDAMVIEDGSSGVTTTVNPLLSGCTGFLWVISLTDGVVVAATAQGTTTDFSWIPTFDISNLYNYNQNAAAIPGAFPVGVESVDFTITLQNPLGYTATVAWIIGLRGAITYPITLPASPLIIGGLDDDQFPQYVTPVTVRGDVNGPQTRLCIDGAFGYSTESVKIITDPPQHNLALNSTLASGGSTELIAGVASQSIRLRRLQFTMNAAEQVSFATAASGGTEIFNSPSIADYSSPDLAFDNYILAADTPLYLNNLGTGTVTVTGRLTYDQY